MRLIASIILTTVVPAAAASLDTMIPSPQEVEALEAVVPAAGGVIELRSDDPQTAIAAEEINARIAKLGGQPLPIGEGGDGPRIVLSVGEAAPNRPQGYAITHSAEEGREVFALTGHDVQGMLYAAVTFRHMLAVEDGRVVIRAANVRDWPDFRLRHLGQPFMEPLRDYYYQMRRAARDGDLETARELGERHIAVVCRYVDWLLRHKINMMGPLIPGRGYAEVTGYEREVCRRINEYARDRGIISEIRANISIGRHPQDEDNPDFADVVMHRSHNRYFCWSRLDYHREKAAAIADLMRDGGFGALYLHDVDGGGWRNPALWDDRCQLCRETYGDDHARADAVVFGIYYDAIREAVPDAVFAAVIYPYSPHHIDPDAIEEDLRAEMGDVPGVRRIAERAAGDNRAMLERLNTLVPDDWHICIRENDRERVDLFREVWDPKPFYTYFEYMRYRSVQPWFATSPRCTASFLYEGYEDILFGSIPQWGFREPLRLYAAQAAWNSAAADPAPFTKRAWHDWRQTQQPREVAERWALRTATDLWGAEVAPYTLPLFTRNLSPHLLFDTEEVVDRAGIADASAVMREQFDAASECTQSMHQLFDRILAGKIEPKPYWFGDLTNYYRLVVAARALAGFKHRRALLEEAVIGGDIEREAELLADLRASIGRWAEEIQRVRERTRELPISDESPRQTVAKGYLLALTGDMLREQLDQFLQRRDEIAAAYAMPGWFTDFARRREFHATRAGATVTIDGRLDEDVWARAEPIEHFVVYDQLRLAAYETVARLGWDSGHLYAAFECFDPAPEEIDLPRRDRDEHEQLDSVEVLVDANDDDETFRHWIIDLGGNTFDAARLKRADGTLDYDIDWDGDIQQAIARLDDRFVVELAIPAEALDATPGEGTWGIHLARNIAHDVPQYQPAAPRYLDGEGFHAVAKYGPLHFEGPESRMQPPSVRVETGDRSLEQKVHEEGQSTEVRFGLRIETDRSLHGVTATARLIDPRGQAVLEQTVMEQSWVELMHRSRRPLFLEVKRACEGLLLEVVVSADEGSWSTRAPVGQYRPAPPDEAELFAPGIDGQALAATMVAPSFVEVGGDVRHLVPSSQGTIECWLCPTEDVVVDREADRLQRTIIDIGPVRYDHPYLTNWRSIALHVNKWAQLVFQITSRQYDSRSVQAKVDDWQVGEWHHVACQWRLDDDGRCRMQLFIDGDLASDQVRGKFEGEPPPLDKRDELLPIQVGAMNTGAARAEMLIDELRFSLVRRYDGRFEPAPVLQADETTSLLLHFDDDLTAHSGLEGVSVEGRPGTAG
ncbi:MAG: glycoside hydrolase family 20 zincin-like fold domain-containing protein [Armatimonadota bacterium]|nr:glycoside hydrolase family 20 zincin-like fold domain-containing protein [Armatimonadota bacterium]